MNAVWNSIAVNWGGIIVNIVFDLLALYFIIVLLAGLDIIFTKVIEGTCKGVVKGGELVRFPIQYAGRYFDKTTGEVKEGVISTTLLFRLWKRLFGGIRFLGIPLIHSLWEYKITFIRKGSEKPEDNTYNYINLAIQNFNLPPKIVRTDERIGVKIEYALLLRIKNPRKAMVEPRPNFLQTVDDLIDAALRFWASSKKFDEVMKVREETKGKELEKHLIGKVGQKILDQYGVEIVNIAIKNVSPEKPDILEALEEAFEAEKRLEASKKEAKSIGAIGTAHAGVAKKVLDSTAGKTADEVVAASMLLDAQKGGASNSELASSRKTAIGLKPLATEFGKAIRGDRREG